MEKLFKCRVEIVFQIFPLLWEEKKGDSGECVDDEDQPGQQVGVAVVDPAVLQKALVDGVKRQLHQMLKHLFRQHCVCFTVGTLNDLKKMFG